MKKVLIMVAVGVLSTGIGFGQDEAGAEGTPTVEQRLARIEQNVELILRYLGSPGGRTSLSDYTKREFQSTQQSIRDLEAELRQIQSELRRLR